ncbi:5'(3')-deoxyribonucleotidase [Elizabethkingia argentiflava]|uniref:5'(3')-deoxyribonucleotidase n=1 Tax=Elizabethkingia argenteiflava TaxID=2681556 RepID=A0A845PUX3_9FLAO|nr:5'(3')-deoxyribonucleotidase [Elizabethkingia argenteiflava]NAW51455.1 5'(3')-deoxyribonucleotidase [Elizabethkingia argenteiflava]
MIADSISLILDKYNHEYHTEITKQSLWGKTVYDLLPEVHIPVIKNYQNSADFYHHVPLVEGAQDAVAILSEKYNIYIVSAALEFPNSLSARYHFIETHFPSISWRNLIFCANKSLIKAHFLIDDMVENLKDFGKSGFLFTAYHNVNIDYPSRLNNWEEILERFG